MLSYLERFRDRMASWAMEVLAWYAQTPVYAKTVFYRYTSHGEDHARRVEEYVREIGEYLGLSEAEIILGEAAAWVHDISLSLDFDEELLKKNMTSWSVTSAQRKIHAPLSAYWLAKKIKLKNGKSPL